ncbi:hypothetical protein MAA8898_00895 [Maliponia aquimaris]|uniref:Uncharacterized protein n=1 Tax=Maliponia aquimaris TaxID=1673631 RepID=A0A238K3J1_9RHOB|nr:hypothetical protein MAA8898_00895 [Maliponia aquimaris]
MAAVGPDRQRVGTTGPLRIDPDFENLQLRARPKPATGLFPVEEHLCRGAAIGLCRPDSPALKIP